MYTEGKRGPAWRRRGGSYGLCRERTPLRPRPCTQPCLGVPGGTRWVCRAEEGTFLPCAVCRRAQAAPAAPAPPRCPPRLAIPAGAAGCWHRWSSMWLWPGASSSEAPPPQQHGALGRGVPGARIRALGRVRHPASPLRTVGDSGEQRWLLWLGGGDLPAGHTAWGVGAPGLKAQPNGRQCRGHTPALRTAHPVRPS